MDNAVTPTPVKPRRRGVNAQYPDRIKISVEAVQRLALWNEQIGGRLRGIKLTRSDLVNFIILGHSEALTAAELNELRGRYFDEVRFVLWAIEEKKAADARGEEITVAEIMEQHRPENLTTSRSRSRKSSLQKNTDNTGKNAQKKTRDASQESLNSVDNPAGE